MSRLRFWQGALLGALLVLGWLLRPIWRVGRRLAAQEAGRLENANAGARLGVVTPGAVLAHPFRFSGFTPECLDCGKPHTALVHRLGASS